MSKKVIKIGNKTFLVDSETKEMEEIEDLEEDEKEVEEEDKKDEEEEVEEEEEKEEEKEGIDEEVIESAAKEVAKKLNLEGIHSKLDKVINAQVSKSEKISGTKMSDLLNLETLMKKSVGQMTAKEKIIGFYQAMIQNNQQVLKALSEGTAADGGYLFPDEFRAEIIRDMTEGNYMRNEVQVIPMKRDIMNMPTLESRPKVTWTDENETKSTTTAHYGEKTLTVKKMAAILYASDELVEDSTEIDVVEHIINLFSESIGEEEDRVIWRGNGTTQPTGVSTARAAGSIGTRSAAGAFSVDYLIDLIYDLPGKYHKNAKIWVHRTRIRDLRKMKDSNNRYYWQEPVAAGQPPTFYGYQVKEVNDLPESEMYFGDMKKAYYLGDRKRMTVKVSQDTETAFTKDQTAIRVVSRIAGNVVLPQAIKCLNNL